MTSIFCEALDGECFDMISDNCEYGKQKKKLSQERLTKIKTNEVRIKELEEKLDKIITYISWNVCPICDNNCNLCALYPMIKDGVING